MHYIIIDIFHKQVVISVVCPESCTLQMVQPKNVILLPFLLHRLHLSRGLVNFVLLCLLMFATLMPETPSTWRCPFLAGKISENFLRDSQVAVNHRKMDCWLSSPWGFKFKKCSWLDTSQTFLMDGHLDTLICIAVSCLSHSCVVDRV